MYLCSYTTKFTQYSSRDTATNVGISFTYLSVCFWFPFCVVWAYSLKLEPGCLAWRCSVMSYSRMRSQPGGRWLISTLLLYTNTTTVSKTKQLQKYCICDFTVKKQAQLPDLHAKEFSSTVARKVEVLVYNDCSSATAYLGSHRK